MKSYTFYVATYRPAFPEKGIKYQVYREKEFSFDVLPPTLTALFQVEHVTSKEEAVAACLEKLAGKNVTVYPMTMRVAPQFRS